VATVLQGEATEGDMADHHPDRDEEVTAMANKEGVTGQEEVTVHHQEADMLGHLEGA